ncbi:major facilitator superfamily domain-containing protein [Aspergillus venezuelensis]
MSQTQEILLEDLQTKNQARPSFASASPSASSTTNTTSTPSASASTPEQHFIPLAKSRSITVVIALSGVSFLNTMGSGILTVALPAISTDLNLNHNLLLWPAAVYALSAGCTLLIFGTVADVIGAKKVWVTGSVLFAGLTLACGLARSGNELIAFRTLLGIAVAMCLPCAVSLMTRTFPPGRARNLGFACMGMGQPFGYSVGLILGGIFADSIGWRVGYYISAGINAILCGIGFWSLPGEVQRDGQEGGSGNGSKREGLKRVDWVGAGIISVSLALVSFVLAKITESYHNLNEPYTITLFAISLILLPTFVAWVEYQERRGRPALIPNSLWKNRLFSATCVIVFFAWAELNALQYFTSLYFQEIQETSAFHSSLMFLPMVVAGAITNIFTGYTVDKVSVGVLVFVSALLSTVSPIIMALVRPEGGYWAGPFVVLFTVSNLIISFAYPGQNQALAGAVFNAVSQVGNSVGIAVSAAVAASVTEHSGKDAESAQLEGYQAAYWLMFASMVVVCGFSYFGLRGGGYVGKKNE